MVSMLSKLRRKQNERGHVGSRISFGSVALRLQKKMAHAMEDERPRKPLSQQLARALQESLSAEIAFDWAQELEHMHITDPKLLANYFDSAKELA